MTLKRLIASKAMELMQLLEHCEDGDFVDKTIAAVSFCDYAALDELEDEQEDDDGERPD